jgi:tol-pal system protein YbgF
VRHRAAALVLALPLVAGCALRSDVTKLRLQMDGQARAAAQRDSASRANLAAIARLVQGMLDSLAVQQGAMASLKGDLRVDLYNIQQQLVAVQELTGQSQQRLTELRAQLEQRSEQLAAQAAAAPPDSAAGAAGQGAAPAAGAAGAPASPAAGQPGPDRLMELALQQLRRGSPATARTAFAEFLRLYPTHPRAGDAWFFIGESWTAEQRADSAAAAYRAVVQRYPSSDHVAAALYKLGVIAAAAGRRDEARAEFNQLVATYPLSQEAALAREQLRTLGAAAPPPGRPPR